ncbi:hypothetical protein FOH10_10400 [Nocardia otitidiscaviarum]|uniref:Uncharacterized protein n=1 Tax=Nocardia otitidiscaviarum TaxID=1823 RepID=A0A516NJJ7_9NOCA|nr:hypothetical protein [Nocardia otitidiscaviarum]MCP9625065.1 hypothetical protein [Nocardia otitidiscaviarum]QDP79077.1 hypothetical protein FOH10_10400 [Nocardia otitidiscaviarum]
MGFTYEAPRNLELADCALDPSTVRPYGEQAVVALHSDCDPSTCRFARPGTEGLGWTGNENVRP